jgi:hypothetical protein
MKFTIKAIAKLFKEMLDITDFETDTASDGFDLTGSKNGRRFRIIWGEFSKIKGEDEFIVSTNVSMDMSFPEIDEVLIPGWQDGQNPNTFIPS